MQTLYSNPDTVWSRAGRPFNHAVAPAPGRTIYLTGQVAWDTQGRVVGAGNTARQTDVCFDHMEAILAGFGGRLTDLVSLTLHWTVEADLAAITEVRKLRLPPETAPASTGVCVAALVDPALLVELTGIAVIPETRLTAPTPVDVAL